MKKEKKQLQRLAWQTAWEKKLKGDLEFYFKRSPYMESLWLRFLIWIGARTPTPTPSESPTPTPSESPSPTPEPTPSVIVQKINSLWLKFLIWIGARSKCCGARFEDYGYEKEWCSKCDKKDKQNEKSTR